MTLSIMEGVLGGLANARRGVLEQRATQFTRLIGRRLDTGDAAGDGEWHQRSWISERPVQSSDGQGVAARLKIGRATGQRLGGVGTDIGVRVADESNESCGVLRSAEADDEPGGVTPVLPGPGQQCSKADCDGLLVERADSCCEDHGGAGEGSAKRPSERIIGRSGDSAEARGEIAQGSLNYLTPVVAVLLGIVFVDQRLTWSLIIGTAMILVGIWLAEHSPDEREVASDTLTLSEDEARGRI